MNDDSRDDDSADADWDVDPDASHDSVEVEVAQGTAWTRPGMTGVSSVDAAIDELARLDELPTSEHVAVYDVVHRQLQDALADLDGA